MRICPFCGKSPMKCCSGMQSTGSQVIQLVVSRTVTSCALGPNHLTMHPDRPTNSLATCQRLGLRWHAQRSGARHRFATRHPQPAGSSETLPAAPTKAASPLRSAAALQDLAVSASGLREREASWSAPVLWRFSPLRTEGRAVASVTMGTPRPKRQRTAAVQDAHAFSVVPVGRGTGDLFCNRH